MRRPRELAFFLALLATLLIPTAAIADDSAESTCKIRNTHANLLETGVVVKDTCLNGDEIGNASSGKNSRTPAENGTSKPPPPPPTTKVTTLVDACSVDATTALAKMGCISAANAGCLPMTNGEYVKVKTVDTAAPDQAPTFSDSFCTGTFPDLDLGTGPGGGPPVVINDVAEAFAADPVIESDTDGRGVRNAETNFYSDTAATTKTTTINGVLVDMRLTPVAFVWDYGDGSAPVTTPTGGTAQSGFDEATSTSHVYEETGRYTVTLTTVYVGEVRYEGGGWQRVPGQITLDAEPVVADIWTTSTRNVADDCSASPGAWGCTGTVEAPPGG